MKETLETTWEMGSEDNIDIRNGDWVCVPPLDCNSIGRVVNVVKKEWKAGQTNTRVSVQYADKSVGEFNLASLLILRGLRQFDWNNEDVPC